MGDHLQGKAAVITGGGRGIGRAISLALQIRGQASLYVMLVQTLMAGG